MKEYTINVINTGHKAILKFESNHFLIKNSSLEFDNIDQAKNSPLAQKLFHLPFVKKVYISSNFIAIERYDIVEWADVQQEVADQITAYLNSGGVIVAEEELSKIPIMIYAESTPNPAVMKFVANKKIALQANEFKNIDDAKHSLLARELFHLPFVKEVFIDENYVSISKYDMADWNDITIELREFIKNHIEQGKEVISTEAPVNQSEDASIVKNVKLEDLDHTSQQIVGILDEYIKPAVQSDGGNIIFNSYDQESKKVSVILQGACNGCPSSTFTLKNGIENMLKDMLQDPQISVEALNG